MTIENDIRLNIEDIGKETDWANINHYKEANAELGAPLDSEKRVVFIGDSITENWASLSQNSLVKINLLIVELVDKRHLKC